MLPPRLVGPNMTYTIQVAIDGVNFIDALTVKLTVDNEGVMNETGFTPCGVEDIRNVVVRYVEEGTGKELAEADVYKGYLVTMIAGLGIAPKQIEGYELVKSPEIDEENDFVLEGREYTYEYRKVQTPDPDPEPKPDPDPAPTPDPEPVNPAPNPENPTPAPGTVTDNNGSQKLAGKKDISPKTGDTAAPLPYAVAGLSALAVLVFSFKRKRER